MRYRLRFDTAAYFQAAGTTRVLPPGDDPVHDRAPRTSTSTCRSSSARSATRPTGAADDAPRRPPLRQVRHPGREGRARAGAPRAARPDRQVDARRRVRRGAHGGDNTGLVATDTMRNVVYALAAERTLDLAAGLRPRPRRALPRAPERDRRARAASASTPGSGLAGDHPHAWQRGAGGTRVEEVRADPGGMGHSAGIDDLLVLRPRARPSRGFHRDRFTTLPETDDRILATDVRPAGTTPALGRPRGRLGHGRATRLLDAFTTTTAPRSSSRSTGWARPSLERDPGDRADPPVAAEPPPPALRRRASASTTAREVFHATTEPFGLIEATVERRLVARPAGHTRGR